MQLNWVTKFRAEVQLHAALLIQKCFQLNSLQQLYELQLTLIHTLNSFFICIKEVLSLFFVPFPEMGENGIISHWGTSGKINILLAHIFLNSFFLFCNDVKYFTFTALLNFITDVLKSCFFQCKDNFFTSNKKSTNMPVLFADSIFLLQPQKLREMLSFSLL